MTGLSQSNDSLPLLELAPVSTGVGLASGLAPQTDMDLARTRLGVLYGLFLGLRAKHPPTAIHSLRVAMSCSKWATIRRMSDADRDVLEVSALLHDIGKLGIPEQVLQKTSRLHGEEKAMMDLHAQLGLELLRDAHASTDVLGVLATYRQWYDQSPDFEKAANGFSLMARMIAIVDAFDSMTGGQVFRPSLSMEQAVAELQDKAGTQFDPYLVKEFTALVTQPIPVALEGQLVRRWLTELHQENKPIFADRAVPFANAALQTMVDSIYHRQLFDSINDAAVYVDSEKRILNWNRSAERMTGQQGSALINQVWTAEIMGLRDELGKLWESEDCPLDEVELKRRPLIRHLDLFHREGHVFKIKLHVLPVINSNQDYCGAILLAQDASTQVTLEERVQTLYERMTRDPLTGVSNREQLDRRLQEFVPERLESGTPGSLIMCDIDHFKRINDNFGHQAGDDALVSFARILRELSRASDMVARYGGEEFVVMCRDCDLNTAMERAQEIRRAVENEPMQSLRGSTMTASFGVTQIQPGDTGETLLARADRALLIAKETGRNRVVQLTAGQAEILEEAAPSSGWFSWFRKRRDNAWIIEREFIIPLPDDVALEKLSGFIHDHHATIVKIEANEASFRLDCYQTASTRRKADRPADMLVVVQWQKVRFSGRHGIEQTKTWLKIRIGAMRANDRRLAALMELGSHVLRSLVAYMGAEELDEQTRKKIFEAQATLASSDSPEESATQ